MDYHVELEQHWQLKKELFIELHRNCMNMINNIKSQLFSLSKCEHQTIRDLYGTRQELEAMFR